MAAKVAALSLACPFLACALLAATRAQAADTAKQLAYGRHLASECTTCHRADGSGSAGIPPITGWDAPRFVQTMKFYQGGARTNPVMVSVSTALDDAQIEALAAYWGSLPKAAPNK